MTETKTITRAEPSTGSTNTLLRHLVLLDPVTGEPSDRCLCGHIWDAVFIAHGEEICQKCVEESKKIPRRP